MGIFEPLEGSVTSLFLQYKIRQVSIGCHSTAICECVIGCKTPCRDLHAALKESFAALGHLNIFNNTISLKIAAFYLFQQHHPPPQIFDICIHKCGPRAKSLRIMWPSWRLELSSPGGNYC